MTEKQEDAAARFTVRTSVRHQLWLAAFGVLFGFLSWYCFTSPDYDAELAVKLMAWVCAPGPLFFTLPALLSVKNPVCLSIEDDGIYLHLAAGVVRWEEIAKVLRPNGRAVRFIVNFTLKPIEEDGSAVSRGVRKAMKLDEPLDLKLDKNYHKLDTEPYVIFDEVRSAYKNWLENKSGLSPDAQEQKLKEVFGL